MFTEQVAPDGRNQEVLQASFQHKEEKVCRNPQNTFLLRDCLCVFCSPLPVCVCVVVCVVVCAVHTKAQSAVTHRGVPIEWG